MKVFSRAAPAAQLDDRTGQMHNCVMGHQFTSLAATIEKLLEAEYFLGGMVASVGDELRYNLNAFLAACRSVTFVLQKSMAPIPSFKLWYVDRQAEMRADAAMGFFLELRNISQHEGPVSIVGGSTIRPPGWTYRFAGNREAVPEDLVGVGMTRACADHLIKLAELVAGFLKAFPYESCLHAAFSADGMSQLGFTLSDVTMLLGLPTGYLDVGEGIPIEEKLRILRREVDGLDRDSLERIVHGDLRKAGESMLLDDGGGLDLSDDIADLIESGEMGTNPRIIFLSAIGRRISEIEGGS